MTSPILPLIRCPSGCDDMPFHRLAKEFELDLSRKEQFTASKQITHALDVVGAARNSPSTPANAFMCHKV